MGFSHLRVHIGRNWGRNSTGPKIVQCDGYQRTSWFDHKKLLDSHHAYYLTNGLVGFGEGLGVGRPVGFGRDAAWDDGSAATCSVSQTLLTWQLSLG